MRRRERLKAALIGLIAVVATWLVLPGTPAPRLPLGTRDLVLDFRAVQGLDLQGGLQVLLQAAPPGGGTVDREAMVAARAILEQRVDAFGTTEPVIQLQGADRIVVEIPGVKSQEDRERAVALFGETGLLEFVDVGTAFPPADTRLETGQDAPYPTILTGEHLDPRKVGVAFDERNRPVINFGWDGEGARIFGEFTEQNVGRNLAIVLDGVVLSAPRIQSRIDGEGQITGQFSVQEARDIVTKLKYGALPVPMTVIQQREVSASLGQDSVRTSVIAGAVGLGVVMAYMLIYYRLPGLVADLALFIYAVLTYAAYTNPWFPVTLTLAGVAGFILSIGMAVDANVLIFERMREELRAGRSLGSAIETGFARAWTSIWDSNVATWITCAILFWFGTGLIRGFALTLALGVAVSMFTAITVTRTFLRVIIGAAERPLARYPALFSAGTAPPAARAAAAHQGSPLFDIVGRRLLYFALSALLILPGSLALGAWGLPLGIDFTGGSLLEIRLESGVVAAPAEVRETLAQSGLDDASVVTSGDASGQTVYLIRTRAIDTPAKNAALQALESRFGSVAEDRFESVGPSVGEETAHRAIAAVVAAAAMILLYLWFAFRQVPKPWRYGACAVAALLHDALLILGLWAILGRFFGFEVDALFVTAVLTVIGFSVHDTIVVFDRVRENVRQFPGESFERVVNFSINQTLDRSLNTGLATVFTLTALLLLGGETIRDFSLALLVGIVSGTYSSIFNASCLLVVWENGELGQLWRLLGGRRPAAAQAPAS
jgi:SecD/SecF fusion protein